MTDNTEKHNPLKWTQEEIDLLIEFDMEEYIAYGI